MKKLLIPFTSLALLMANGSGAQTKTTTATAAKSDKKTAVKPHTKHHKKRAVMAIEREETITLDDTAAKTVIDIQNGGVYVNGDLISTIADAKKESHKIVITNTHDSKVKEEQEEMNGYSVQKELEDAPVRKALLGVRTMDIGDNDGARVTMVMHNSPADEAGLQNGDKITKLGGMEVKGASDLVAAVNDHDRGETVSITYMRDGNERTTHAKLGSKDGMSSAELDYYGEVPNHDGEMTMPEPFMGNYMAQRHLMENDGYFYEYALKMGIAGKNEEDGKGVEITEINEGSAAEEAGLKKGDVITWLDHQRVHTVDDIQTVLSYSWSGETMKIVVKRNGESLSTHIHLSMHGFKKNL